MLPYILVLPNIGLLVLIAPISIGKTCIGIYIGADLQIFIRICNLILIMFQYR